MMSVAKAPNRQKTTLGDLALLFLKLGTIAFGGPAAHIAMMEDEVVRRRRWLTRDECRAHVHWFHELLVLLIGTP